MKTVMRGNKQLRISDDRLDGYLALGYVEIDPKTGVPINPPVSAEALKKENAALKKANAELAAKVKAAGKHEESDKK